MRCPAARSDRRGTGRGGRWSWRRCRAGSAGRRPARRSAEGLPVHIRCAARGRRTRRRRGLAVGADAVAGISVERGAEIGDRAVVERFNRRGWRRIVLLLSSATAWREIVALARLFAIISTLIICGDMKELAFEIAETAHALRRCFDRRASSAWGSPRPMEGAARLAACPGMRQVDLAERSTLSRSRCAALSTGWKMPAWSSGSPIRRPPGMAPARPSRRAAGGAAARAGRRPVTARSSPASARGCGAIRGQARPHARKFCGAEDAAEGISMNKMKAGAPIEDRETVEAEAQVAARSASGWPHALGAGAARRDWPLFLADRRHSVSDRQCLCEAGRLGHLDPGQRAGRRRSMSREPACEPRATCSSGSIPAPFEVALAAGRGAARRRAAADEPLEVQAAGTGADIGGAAANLAIARRASAARRR